MEPLRLDTLATQVVAWHNRHPLARRISAAQVQAIGFVVLPAVQVQMVPLAAPPTPEAAAAEVDFAGMAAAVAVEADAPADRIAADVAGDLEADVAAELATDIATDIAVDVAAEISIAQPSAGAPPPAASLRERLTARPAAAASAAPSTAAPTAATATAPISAPTTASPGAAAGHHAPPLRLACSERIVDHTSAANLARWVLQHGRLLAVKLPAEAPVWQLPRDAALSVLRPGVPERPVSLLLRTATLHVGQRRLRLLVGPGADPAVLGPRLWSGPRLALACLPLLLLPVTAATAWWLGAQTARQQAHAAVAGTVASPVTSASGIAEQAAQPAAHAASPASAAAATAAASAAYAASAASAAQASNAATLAALAQPPVEAEPRQGTVELPPLGPLFSDPRFDATRQRRMAARAARAAAPEAQAAAAPAEPLLAVPKPQAAALAVPTAAFALATRPLRTAAEAEQVQVAMRTLLTLTDNPASGQRRVQRVQRIPVGDDWRVMGGPDGSRAAAERARGLLLARGVKTEVVVIPPAPAVAAAAAQAD